MIQQGFSLGDRDWYVMCAYDIRTEEDINEVGRILLASGCPYDDTEDALEVLSGYNKGFTFSNLKDHLTIVCVSKSTSAEQFYDTLSHEQKHAVEHISECYGVDPKSETSAYLQGEIGRLMFPAAAMIMCPICSHK